MIYYLLRGVIWGVKQNHHTFRLTWETDLSISLKGGRIAIRQSAQGHFGDEVFPLINADDFMVLYSDNGRGSSYLQGPVGHIL